MKQLQSVVLAGLMLWGLLITPAFVFAGDDFARWKHQMRQDFQGFKDERDREFTAFLQAHWREMELLYGVKRDKTPKPKKIPRAKPPSRPKPTPQLPRVKPPVVPQPSPKPPPAPVIPAPGTRIKVNFYGHKLPFRIDSDLKVSLGFVLNKQSISEYWAKLSRADYEPLLEQLEAQRSALQLNDWAFILLVHKLVKQFQSNSKERMLLTWFILVKKEYRARIAYDSEQIYLLMPTKQALYAVSYFTFDSMNYYDIPFDGKDRQQSGRVYTYDSHYPGATKSIDMHLPTAIVTREQPTVKHLTFRYDRTSYKIKAKYHPQTVNFLKTYPQMDIDMYFKSAIHPETGKQLLEQLKPLVTGKSELDAVNLLLGFVQKAFKYKTDNGQFGEENYLFPDETLYYPYSDCEDRSVLFAWLVRQLLKLEVVGLDYPGHIAAAVRFNGTVKGDSVPYSGTRYVITDPTFINARAGMVMPQYKDTNPKVIPIRSDK